MNLEQRLIFAIGQLTTDEREEYYKDLQKTIAKSSAPFTTKDIANRKTCVHPVGKCKEVWDSVYDATVD